MKTPRKLILFILLLIAFYAAFGVLMKKELTHIGDLVERIYRHSLATTRGALSTSRDIILIDRDIKNMLLINNMDRKKSLLMDIDLYQKRVALQIEGLLVSIVDEQNREIALKVKSLLDEQKAIAQKIGEEVLANNNAKARYLEFHEGQKITKVIENSLDNLSAFSAINSKRVRKRK